MKIFVRIVAEAQAPILNREIVDLENAFTKAVAEEIVKSLRKFSSYRNRRLEALPQRSFEKERETRQQKIWSEGRLRKTQRLRDSWAYLNGPMGSRNIYNKLPYGIFLARGTGIYGPHGLPITPREKKALAFYSSMTRKWVITRSVRGINPARFKTEVIDPAQREGTIAGVRRAMIQQEKIWRRGTLTAKLIL